MHKNPQKPKNLHPFIKMYFCYTKNIKFGNKITERVKE